MYQTIIRGGNVIDPSQGIHGPHDIGIQDGLIAAIAPEITDTAGADIIQAGGLTVTPGLIDMHAHVAHTAIELGTSPDLAGVSRGVTTVCDGGSTGCANFQDFLENGIKPARTDVFCYLHIARTGLLEMPEISGWADVDADAAVATARAHPDVIKGIKFRAVMPAAADPGIEMARTAKKIATEAGLPLMVHIGDGLCGDHGDVVEAFTRELADLLDKGDIITHIYAGAPGGLVKPDGTVFPELRAAIRRGVLLDTAHGRPNLSFAVVRAGLEQGILPDIISTDLASTNVDNLIFSLVLTMSKFLALGLTLDQVIAMTTINPARALGEETRRGTLRPGTPADVSILKLVPGDYTFHDGVIGNQAAGKTLVLPELTLKNGLPITPRPGAENEIA
jgi:dihydroorotase